jgi:cytochrome b
MRSEPVAVWDLAVRLIHWAQLMLLTLAWISTLGWGLQRWHEPAGWVAATLVAIRVVWGFSGGRYARFAGFVVTPAALLRYLRELRDRTEVHAPGHNPLGGWMVVALLSCIALTCCSGWLFTTDRFWGSPAVAAWHAGLAWTLLGLVALHVAGVLFTSARGRRNLVAAMITGRAVLPGQDSQASRD